MQIDYLLAGLGTGIIHAAGYNPADRALYLSVKESRKFLHKENWLNPFQGLRQSLFHRVLNGGLYFSIQSTMKKYTDNSMYIGLVGGVTNAIILNQISVIKYNCWRKTNITFVESVTDLYKNGGLKIFSKGMKSTVMRDIVFCCAYEMNRVKKSKGFTDEIYNLGVGVGATILASPFNYVRNIKYATPSNIKCKSDVRILHELIKNRNFGDLRIGWGTLRCGLGMMTGQMLYDNLLKGITYMRDQKFE